MAHLSKLSYPLLILALGFHQIFLAPALSLCESTRNSAPNLTISSPVNLSLGAILPLSGPISSLGESANMGLIVAQKFWQERLDQAGITVEFIVEDSRGEPAVAVSAFNKLTNVHRVPVVFTNLSSVALALRPLAERSGVLIFTEGSHPGLTAGYKMVVRSFFTAQTITDGLQAFLTDKKLTRIAVLHAEEEWGQSILTELATRLKDSSREIVATASFEKSAHDLRSQIVRLKTANPDLVIVVGIGAAVALAYRQLNQLGLGENTTKLGIAICGQREVLVGGGEALTGTYTLELAVDRNSAAYGRFKSIFAELYPGAVMDQSIVAMFDGFGVVAEALISGKRSGSEIREFVDQKRKFAGLTGQIEFSPEGEAPRAVELKRVMQGGRCE